VKREKGRIDILFANAGGGEFVPLGAIIEEHFDKTFNINVKGLLFTVQKALPLIPDGSSIILNGAIASIKGVPAFSVYSATKAVVRSFARTWSVDLKERKIRVNALSPGPIETPIINGLAGNEEATKQFKANIAPQFQWVGGAARTRSPKSRSFSPPTTAATSPASNYSSMAA